MNEVRNENSGRSKDANQIDFVRLLVTLLRKWYLLLLCAIIGGLLMGWQAYRIPDSYKSNSMLFVISNSTTITSLSNDLQIGSMMSRDFTVIATSKPVIDTSIQTVYERTGVQLTRNQASKAISVSVIDGTRILKFTVVMEDPRLACELCNAITDAVAEQISIIMKSDKPSVIEYAEPSDSPLYKNESGQAFKGAIIGFFLCASVICAIFLLDDKVKSPEDVEKYTDAPVLACIPMDKAQIFDSKKHSKS